MGVSEHLLAQELAVGVDLGSTVQSAAGVVEVDVAGGVEPAVLATPELRERARRVEARVRRQEGLLRGIESGDAVRLAGAGSGGIGEHRGSHVDASRSGSGARAGPAMPRCRRCMLRVLVMGPPRSGLKVTRHS